MENRTEIKRKLAAILHADVVGYSRLIRQDEEATVALLRRYRHQMGGSIGGHGGRVADAPGDNLLAEFPSVVQAVRCAVEVQEAIAQANAVLPPDRRMLFRIGINSGEVIQEGDRIYGNGVNVAARLQELAPAGGIAISESVYEEVRGRLSLTYEFLGEHLVKNIDRPLKVYAVGPHKVADEHREPPEKRMMRRKKATWALVILGVLLLGALSLLFSYRSALWPPERTPAEVKPTPASPSPSIAVLPFLELSDAAEQERLGDGIAEDIITALAAMPRLSVVSRTSTFRYKGKVPDPKELGRELKVRYILEGSVQKEGLRVRVTAQLIDAETGLHLWAERYDLEAEDLFALRDDVTLRVVKALQAQLAEREGFSMKPRQTDSLKAYLRFLRARSYASYFVREKNAQARHSFQGAISLDPGFLDAYPALAHTYITDWWLGWETSGENALEQARWAAAKLQASHPGLSPELFASRLPFKNDSQWDSFLNALRQTAGN